MRQQRLHVRRLPRGLARLSVCKHHHRASFQATMCARILNSTFLPLAVSISFNFVWPLASTWTLLSHFGRISQKNTEPELDGGPALLDPNAGKSPTCSFVMGAFEQFVGAKIAFTLSRTGWVLATTIASRTGTVLWLELCYCKVLSPSPFWIPRSSSIPIKKTVDAGKFWI